MSIWDVILLAAAGVIAVPVGVIAVETGAALLVRGARRGEPGLKPVEEAGAGVGGDRQVGVIAVLVPAHDEEGVIGRTLAGLRGQLRVGDRLVVVADNCADGTARVAREAGAEVVERRDEGRRGKGYALAAGVEYLRGGASAGAAGDLPEVVVVVDADMTLAAGSVEALARAAARGGVPVQAIDLLEPPAGAGMRTRVSAFAFAFKNLVRALGAEALGVPCILRGTGMAFPWQVMVGAKLASGNLVEDMQLGVDLAIGGFVPRLCREARVTGELPEKTGANKVQRTRWEQGHLQTIMRNVPMLVWEGLRQGRLKLWLLTLDVAVPPLALVVLLWCGLAMVAAVAAWIGWASVVPLGVLIVIGGMMGASILAAWAGFARHIVPLTALLAVPFYIVWKIPVYVGFLVKREKVWIRTERST